MPPSGWWLSLSLWSVAVVVSAPAAMKWVKHKGVVEVSPRSHDGWAWLHIKNNGDADRFKVLVERIGSPIDSKHEYAAAWREQSDGSGRSDEWRMLALREPATANIAYILTPEDLGIPDGSPPYNVTTLTLRFWSAINPLGRWDATGLLPGAEIRCRISVIREHGEPIVRDYTLRLTRRSARDNLTGGLVGNLRFDFAKER